MSREPFNPQKLFDLMPGVESRFLYYPEIDSTNLEARRLLRAGAKPAERVLVADLQRAGRGRQGRFWQAPPASGLLCTLLFPLELPLDRAFLYTASLGLSVLEAVRHLTGLKLQLKWPNDLLKEGRKVGGILGEFEMVEGKPWLALGFGLNISLSEEDFAAAGVADKATNLLPEAAKGPGREELLAAILRNFDHYRGLLRKEPERVRQMWASSLVTLGQRVQVWSNGALDLEGEARWVEEDGVLVVEDDGGEFHRVQAGDVSVRLPGGRYSA